MGKRVPLYYQSSAVLERDRFISKGTEQIQGVFSKQSPLSLTSFDEICPLPEKARQPESLHCKAFSLLLALHFLKPARLEEKVCGCKPQSPEAPGMGRFCSSRIYHASSSLYPRGYLQVHSYIMGKSISKDWCFHASRKDRCGAGGLQVPGTLLRIRGGHWRLLVQQVLPLIPCIEEHRLL